jgi:formylglycine-generating enzyme required for sulfatase activity
VSRFYLYFWMSLLDDTITDLLVLLDEHGIIVWACPVPRIGWLNLLRRRIKRPMGSLRGRTRDSSWQWLVIGIVLGLGCSSVVCLAGYATNYIRFNLPGQEQPIAAGPTILVITNTAAPVTASPAATATSNAAPVATQNAAPTITPVNVAVQPTALPGNTTGTVLSTPVGTNIASPVPPTTAPTTAVGTQAALPTVASSSSSGVQLDIPLTDLIRIGGGIYTMGTTDNELTRAIEDCIDRDKGNCDISMGEDATPPHSVTVNDFRLEKYEVSYEQYVAFLNYLGPGSHLSQCDGNPCAAIQGQEFPGSYIRFDGTKYEVTTPIYLNRPVAFVTWYGANSFCRTIGRRLPTEAEWERAARSPDFKRIYPWGDLWDTTRARTNRPKNESGPDQVDAFPLGRSQEGIYNLAGNVSEWVWDWYSATYYRSSVNAIDPKGPTSGTTKVVRGGDWDAVPFFARTMHRRDYDPARPQAFIGFRCAADPERGNPVPTRPRPTGAPSGNATATFTPGPLQSGSGG